MKSVNIYPLILFSFLLVGLNGCSTISSDEARYFSLTPVSQTYTGKALADQLILGIGPVDIPRLINRPELVYRKSNNEIQLSEQSQWAAPIQEGIQNVLIERVIDVSGSHQIMHYPWLRDLQPEYQVRIRIERLDGTPGKEVVLEAHWDLLINQNKQLIRSRKSHYEITLESDDFLVYVIGQQTLLSKLADEILEDVILYQKNN